ncbi:MAG: hypothetical protein QM778_12445 [Myxococcales bacterium]
MNRRLAPLFLALALLSACAEDRAVYSGMQFDVQSAPASPASFEPDRIELVAGEAVKVLARPRSSGEIDYDDTDILVLRSGDPNVLEVYYTEDEREFVLVGSEAGQTCLEVLINRHREECIPVRVLAPVTE